MTDRFLSGADAGRSCALPIGAPNPSTVLDKDLEPKGPGILSSTGAGVQRNALGALPDSNSVLDRC